MVCGPCVDESQIVPPKSRKDEMSSFRFRIGEARRDASRSINTGMSVYWDEVTYDHFVNQDPKSPPVDCHGVTKVFNNLGGNVFYKPPRYEIDTRRVNAEDVCLYGTPRVAEYEKTLVSNRVEARN